MRRCSDLIGDADTDSADAGGDTRQLMHGSDTVSTDVQHLMNTLKCQLQQSRLAQQASNMQLDAVKQVFVFSQTITPIDISSIPRVSIHVSDRVS